jgi:RNA polymerase sigma-B factor
MGTKKDKNYHGISHPPPTGEGKPNKDTLIRKYFFLIAQIVRNFPDVPVSRENLENAGYIGLLNAVNLYDDKTCMLDFKNYAQLLITKEIHHYLSDQTHEIDQPPWLIKLNQKINQFSIEYNHKNKKFPQLSDIADHFNLTEIALQEVLKGRESLKESHFSHQLEHEFSKIQPEFEKIKSKFYEPFKLPIQDVITLQKALLKVKKLQRNIVYYLFVMDLRQLKLSQKNGISNKRIDQIKKDIFHNL